MGAQSDKPRGREDSCIKREQMNGTREARATPAVELQSQFLLQIKENRCSSQFAPNTKYERKKE